MIRIINWFLFFLGVFLFLFAFQTYYKKYFEFSAGSIQKNDSALVTSGSGRDVLPLSVRLTLHILDSLHAKDYCLYGSFMTTQAEFYQRIQEASWPMRLDTSSKILIGYKEEISLVHHIKIVFWHDNICMGIR